MKTLRKSRHTTAIALALSAGLLAGAIAIPTPLRAQAVSPADAANQKMQLMVQAIDARSSGDYAKARDLFAQLLALDPEDPAVKKDLADMDAAIAAQSRPAAGQTAAAPAATPSAATPSSGDASAAKTTTVGMAAAPAQPVTPEAVAALKAQTAKQTEIVAEAGASIDKAHSLIKAGQYDDARTLLEQTQASLPQGLALNDIRADITQELANSWLAQGKDAYNNNQLPTARDDLAKYVAIAGDTSTGRNFQKALDAAVKDPFHQDINIISPNFETKEDKIAQLLIQGKAQYLYGDNEGAYHSFDTVLINDPDNVEAKAYELKITQNIETDSTLNQKVTRNSMLKEVDEDWAMPRVYAQVASATGNSTTEAPEVAKMKKIIIPRVNIDVPTPLDQVAATLKQLSEEYDPEGKGVNIMVYPPVGGGPMPKVSLPNLTNLSLDKLLNIAGNDAKPAYTYSVEQTVVSLREGGSGLTGGGQFETRDFALGESTKTRLLGVTGGGDASGGGGGADPFAASGGGSSTSSSTPAAPAAASSDASGGEPSASDIEDRMQSLFIRAAGADFPAGAKLAYVAGKIYVTNTSHNLDLIEAFLKKYSEVKQVEVEARFLDVTQGDLQEAGTAWNLMKGNTQLGTYNVNSGTAGNNNLQLLANAFPLGSTGSSNTTVAGLTNSLTGALEPQINIPQAIPSLPNALNVGAGASDAFNGVLGVVEGYKLNFILDMLDQRQGDDLMDAPKITVLSSKDATINVAQELRYPDTFGSIQSQVSQASGETTGAGGGGGGGVTVTAGTPENFQTEEIGVSLNVIPQVEEDDSITMHLEPKVTEFEGFIEYGGTSIAIQSGIVATVPSGFIQPVFDVRHLMTDVTIFDGATVVMGGLTRDEVTTVQDKVPVLGDIPLIGRFFQSKGETSQKRNLMIFVTANLISPGGSLANQDLPSVPHGTVFSNPTVDTPSGGFRRVPKDSLTSPASTNQ